MEEVKGGLFQPRFHDFDIESDKCGWSRAVVGKRLKAVVCGTTWDSASL